jgi:cell division cycle protein 20 (cofactor of APC complex)
MTLPTDHISANKHPKTPTHGDRFIPKRSAMDGDMARYNLHGENLDPQTPGSASKRTPSKDSYKATLANNMLGNNNKGPAKILTLQADAPAPPAGHINSMRVLYSQNKVSDYKKKTTTRYIPQAPEKILDAPELMDDYYLNLLDWSSTNILAVALGQTVYLWNAASGNIEELCTTQEESDHITSVSWVQDGNYVAVGTNNAEVQIWDVGGMRQIRSMKGHRARIGALAWNAHTLSSGSRDSTIINHDVRIAQHITSRLEGAHTQEVCGLKWSANGMQLASGGNDNILNIWDASQITPRHQILHHGAAVKALAWCPWQANLLASGGGTACRKMCFWNGTTGALLNEVDTNSQVCSLVWSKHEKEILSSHGFTQNQLTLWKYPSLTKVADLTGHQSRVLHMAVSPDGNTVVSGAADETLRFWKVFGNDGSKLDKGKGSFANAQLARASSIR